MLSAATSPFCRPIAPEGTFCKPEEDPFLLLESTLRSVRTWTQQCLTRVDELDERLLAQQELLQRCRLEGEREALSGLVVA